MAIPPALDRLFTRLLRAMIPVALFVVSALVLYLPGRLVVLPAARRTLDFVDIDPTFELPLLKVVHAVIGAISLFVAATVSGLANFLTATAAITAGVTIALGFAARDVLSNVVSGVFIVLDPTFDIGDWIKWQDREGIIEDISFRVTRVHTFDNELIAVPNSQLTTNAVVNPVAKDRLRLSIPFEIAVENDVGLACRLDQGAASDTPDVLDRAAAPVRVDEIVETSIVLTARFWIDRPERADFIRIRSEFVHEVKRRFETAGVDYPSQDLGGTIGIRRDSVDERTAEPDSG